MKKCPPGQYYCFTDKKCKKIPMGYHVGGRGMLEKDTESETKKNGNGNSNGNGNGNGANGSGNGGNGGNGGGMGEQVVHEGGNLRQWFKGSKSKDGKGGWVNVVTGGTCASDEPGEGTPKCVSSKKRASMTKAERLSAARRKKKADPGQQQKTGAAKPTYVRTDSPRKMKKEEIELIQEKDKKGKGSGTKDACYHKVKSRYSVWPSAYASGALVKCRKVGAANWGNKSEGLSWDQLTEKCWPGYEKKGMKTMFGKRYPNCVKKKATRKEEIEISEAPIPYKVGDTIDNSAAVKNAQQRRMNTLNRIIKGNPKKWDFSQQNVDRRIVTGESLEIEEAVRLPAKTGNIIDAHFVFRGRSFMLKMFFPKVGIPSRSDVIDQINKVYPGAKLTFFRVADHEPGQPLLRVAEERRRDQAVKETTGSNAKASGEISENAEGTLTEKSAAWTRKAGKNKEGGLNEKGRKSYERENPGSDLKAPSKKVGNKRRASFCARMKGMKKKLTSAKTANDPDSRINKSLRAWNC